MLEILQFIFSSFWIWLGSMLMLLVVAVVIESVIVAIARVIVIVGTLRKVKDKNKSGDA